MCAPRSHRQRQSSSCVPLNSLNLFARKIRGFASSILLLCTTKRDKAPLWKTVFQYIQSSVNQKNPNPTQTTVIKSLKVKCMFEQNFSSLVLGWGVVAPQCSAHTTVKWVQCGSLLRLFRWLNLAGITLCITDNPFEHKPPLNDIHF